MRGISTLIYLFLKQLGGTLKIIRTGFQPIPWKRRQWATATATAMFATKSKVCFCSRSLPVLPTTPAWIDHLDLETRFCFLSMVSFLFHSDEKLKEPTKEPPHRPDSWIETCDSVSQICRFDSNGRLFVSSFWFFFSLLVLW